MCGADMVSRKSSSFCTHEASIVLVFPANGAEVGARTRRTSPLLYFGTFQSLLNTDTLVSSLFTYHAVK